MHGRVSGKAVLFNKTNSTQVPKHSSIFDRRSHIRDEVEKHLSGRVVVVSITPTKVKDDIVLFLRAKLKEDIIPDAMDEKLEEEIIRIIRETVSEM